MIHYNMCYSFETQRIIELECIFRLSTVKRFKLSGTDHIQKSLRINHLHIR